MNLTIGNRYLFTFVKSSKQLYEGAVIELSPSKKYVKLTSFNDWQYVADLNLVEDLGPDPKGIPNPEYYRTDTQPVYMPIAVGPEAICVGPTPKPVPTWPSAMFEQEDSPGTHH